MADILAGKHCGDRHADHPGGRVRWSGRNDQACSLKKEAGANQDNANPASANPASAGQPDSDHAGADQAGRHQGNDWYQQCRADADPPSSDPAFTSRSGSDQNDGPDGNHPGGSAKCGSGREVGGRQEAMGHRGPGSDQDGASVDQFQATDDQSGYSFFGRRAI